MKSRIKIEARSPNEALGIASKMEQPRNVAGWEVRVVNNIIEVIFDVASNMVLVMYGFVKDKLPWHLQERCVVCPM